MEMNRREGGPTGDICRVVDKVFCGQLTCRGNYAGQGSGTGGIWDATLGAL